MVGRTPEFMGKKIEAREMKILFVNDQVLNISGLRREDILGISVTELAVTNDLIRTLIRDLVSPENTDENSRIVVTVTGEKDSMIFSVRDFGPGIESRYANRLFERYFQVPGSAKGGTGLGLSISKDFIETQGGIIGVNSTPGLGSTFYFRFPVPA